MGKKSLHFKFFVKNGDPKALHGKIKFCLFDMNDLFILKKHHIWAFPTNVTSKKKKKIGDLSFR